MELQFGYQKNISTSMCTWLAVETIEYYQHHGTNVYGCVMDMTKAFDNVNHSVLFPKIINKGIPEVFIRLLVVMYEKQVAYVRWNDTMSKSFPINNGVYTLTSCLIYCGRNKLDVGLMTSSLELLVMLTIFYYYRQLWTDCKK